MNATSNIGYGIFHVSDSTTLNITGPPTLAFSYATGAFQDVVTISYGPLTGQQGLIDIGYTLDGTLSASGIDHAFTDVSIKVGSALEQSAFAVYQSSVSGLFYFPEFTFTYGQPFGINLALTAYTGTETPRTTQAGAFSNYLQGTGTASSDFSNTLILSSLIVSNSAGNAVSGAQFSSGSGTIYTTSGVVTPEPSTMIFLCIGLGGLGAYFRFLRSRYRS